MTGKIPNELLKDPEPELRNLPLGEVGWVSPSILMVAVDRSCWLRSKAVYEKVRTRVYTVRVTRTEAGYSVAATGSWKWSADAALDWVKNDIPVREISYEPTAEDD